MKCPPTICDCAPRSGDPDTSNVCYLEASTADKDVSFDRDDMKEVVWRRVKPPFGRNAETVPQVSARKVEVTRAYLSGRAKPQTSPVFPRVCEDACTARANTRIPFETQESSGAKYRR